MVDLVMAEKRNKTIARTYVASGAGLECQELILTPRGHMVARGGRIEDARSILTLDQARAWYDGAAYQEAPRP